MNKLINSIASLLYFCMFLSLVAGAAWFLYWLHPYLLYFYLGNMGVMLFGSLIKSDAKLFLYSKRVMLSLDQHWQVICAPLLNLGVTTKHKFGKEDETASSVVGKNLKETNARHWILIELLLSLILEGGKPHSIPSIESDE